MLVFKFTCDIFWICRGFLVTSLAFLGFCELKEKHGVIIPSR